MADFSPAGARCAAIKMFRALLGAMCFLADSALAEITPVTPVAPATSLEQLDQRLAAVFQAQRIPGAAVAVLEKGKVVLARDYGVADVAAHRPVTPDTLFRAGSVSKTLVGIAVMMLVEEGKLDLNAKLRDLAPEISFDNPWEASAPVRLVHLLEHTSGFDDYRFRHFLIDGSQLSLAQAVQLTGPYQSRWKPGTHVSYSNAGPVLAGYLVEKASGMSWPEFTRYRIFEPLKMTSAHWDRPASMAGRLARSYRFDGVSEEQYFDIPGKPAGSLTVSSADLARLAQLFIGRGTVNGVTLLKPASLARIEAPASSQAAHLGLKYGYGLGNTTIAREKAIFHGHDGSIDGFLTWFEYEPAHGAGLVVMINAPQGKAQQAVREIENYLMRDWPVPVIPAIQPDNAALEVLTGHYLAATSRMQITTPIDNLLGWAAVRVENGSLVVNGKTLKAVAPGIFQDPETAAANYAFTPTPAGQLLVTPYGSFRQVPAVELFGKAAFGVAFILLLLANGVMLPVWGWRWFRGKLREPGVLRVVLVPLQALAPLAAIPVIAYTFLTSEPFVALEVLGAPSPLAWLIYGLTLALPVLGVVTLLAAKRAPQGTPLGVRILALSSAILLFAATAYLWPYGWIGLKTWV